MSGGRPLTRVLFRSLLVLALLGAGLFAGGCGRSDPPTALGQERLVTFGHSWVRGGAPAQGVTPWPQQVASQLRWGLDNRGANGATSDAVDRAVRDYDSSPTDTVVLEPMLIDVARRGAGGLEDYRTRLQSMLRHLTAGTTTPAQVIVLADPPISGWDAFRPRPRGSNRILARYVSATRAICAAYPVTYVDLGLGWSPDADLTPVDGAHPSAAGTQKIRDRVLTAIRAQQRTAGATG